MLLLVLLHVSFVTIKHTTVSIMLGILNYHFEGLAQIPCWFAVTDITAPVSSLVRLIE